RSRAPAVVALRTAIERELRELAGPGADVDVLAAWIETPEGRDDAPAHDRLLAALPAADARRPVVERRRSRLAAP
ncbi:transcriptional regulator, partial [Patulibacter sp. S7RM1-6]